MRAQLAFAPAIMALLLLSHSNDMARAFKFSPFQRAPKTMAASQYSDVDLSSLLYTQPVDHEGLFSEALQLLNSMKSSPSCNRIAVTNLITSCQQLDSDDQHRMNSPASGLDHIKSIYAARLAICELTGAGARIPDECSALITHRSSRIVAQVYSANTEDSAAISAAQLESCLQGLESKPQWWTSYSNNRQNAAVMCQAARIEIERDELLSYHRNLVEVTVGISRSLNQSWQDSATEASQQKAFIETIDSMRLKLVDDLQQSGVAARDVFRDFVAEIEASLRDGFTDIQASVTNAESDTASLSRDIRSSVTAAHELKRAINDIYSDAMQGASELAAVERESHRVNTELALAVRQSLEEVGNRQAGVMMEEFGSLYTSLQSLNDLVVSVHQNHASLDKRLNYFNQAFEQLEYKAGILDVILQWHVANHSRFQQSLETDMRVAQALLEEITFSAANLQTTVSEAFQAVSRIGKMGLSMGSIPWWLWTLAFFCLAGLLVPKLIALLFIACIGLLSTGIIGRLRLPEKPSLQFDWSLSYLEIGCFLLGFALSAVAVTIIIRKGVPPIPEVTWAASLQRPLRTSASYLP